MMLILGLVRSNGHHVGTQGKETVMGNPKPQLNHNLLLPIWCQTLRGRLPMGKVTERPRTCSPYPQTSAANQQLIGADYRARKERRAKLFSHNLDLFRFIKFQLKKYYAKKEKKK